MNGKKIVMAALICSSTLAFAQGRESFVQQQTFAEMQRVSGQVDVLQGNLADLQRRVGALEGGGDTRGIRQEIDALKSSVAELRRAIHEMRGEIVKDLSARITKIQAAQTPPPPPRPVERRVVIGPHLEYTVQAGDTLSLIAQAFNTNVAKIKEMNNLKSNNLRVGQKLKLPK